MLMRRASEPERAPSDPSHEEPEGTLDGDDSETWLDVPDLDSSTDDAEATELEIGDQLDPLAAAGADEEAQLDVGMSDGIEETTPLDSDESDGPDDASTLELLDPLPELVDDEAPTRQANSDWLGDAPEPLPALDRPEDDEGGELDVGAELRVDETPLAYSANPWRGESLSAGHSTRAGLALSPAGLLGVAGESTLLVSLRTGESLHLAPLQEPTVRIIALDAAAQEHLILTRTGQLYRWDLLGQSLVPLTTDLEFDRVAGFWQCRPASCDVLLLLETGELVALTGATLKASRLLRNGRVVAASDCGEPRLELTSSQGLFRLDAPEAVPPRSRALPADLLTALEQARAVVLGLGDVELVGVPGVGLWCATSSDSPLLRVAGCSSLSAAAVGVLDDRPTVWIALFSELQDRSTIVHFDPLSGQVEVIAEIEILGDAASPDDEPLERARVAALLWDPTGRRLWAAGGFGLTSWVPSSRHDAAPHEDA